MIVIYKWYGNCYSVLKSRSLVPESVELSEKVSLCPVEEINSFIESFNNEVIFRFVAEEAFRAGFCWAATLALLLGMFSRFFLFFWKPIKAFFAATRSPATNPGPSPFSRMMSCFGQLVLLAIFIGAVGAFVYYRR